MLQPQKSLGLRRVRGHYELTKKMTALTIALHYRLELKKFDIIRKKYYFMAKHSQQRGNKK